LADGNRELFHYASDDIPWYIFAWLACESFIKLNVEYEFTKIKIDRN
jgi:hypothetical protein